MRGTLAMLAEYYYENDGGLVMPSATIRCGHSRSNTPEVYTALSFGPCEVCFGQRFEKICSASRNLGDSSAATYLSLITNKNAKKPSSERISRRKELWGV